ncbi:succinate receptor 1-like [Callorhinchus milii]|uniref:succinate receptor 1-like n=1 Tax=Callorhinchus milii TaxID=7868 RepID=UPI0004573D82|nr:succinate receptor 1-like [Callorhinchus milii]|eukprot:gi/632968730/ref/XP_007900686.1/ PREDICTED: succinate receptor 1-like [Callorhinchus milii]
MNSCPKINEDLEWEYLPIMYSIEFFVGLIGNLTVIFGYVFCLKEWKCSNIYLFNLSITDLAFLCTLPLLVNQYKNKSQWQFSDLLCKFNRFLLYNNMYLSILFLTCISVDRYLLVMNPLKMYKFQNKRGAMLVCFLLYMSVTLALIPMFVFIGPQDITHDEENITACVDFASSGNANHSLIYSMCLTIFCFIFPQCVMIFSGIQTARALKKMSKQHRRNISLEKPLNLVILAVGSFTVFFTPYHIMRNLRIISRMKSLGFLSCTKSYIKAGYTVTRPIAYLNAATNPIFYFLLGDKFRETLMSSIKSIFHRMFPCFGRRDTQASCSSYGLGGRREEERGKTRLFSDSSCKNPSQSCSQLPTRSLAVGSS